jgi:hypothetical protein
MFSTDFIFRQQETLVDNQKCQAGFRPLCNKILYMQVGRNLSDLAVFLLANHDFWLKPAWSSFFRAVCDRKLYWRAHKTATFTSIQHTVPWGGVVSKM